jgi:hypothetical protein
MVSWHNSPLWPRPSHRWGLLISLTPHSLGLLWTSDQPDAEAITWQHTKLTTDIHPCPRRDSNPQFQRPAVDPRLRPRGHWDRRYQILANLLNFKQSSYYHQCNWFLLRYVAMWLHVLTITWSSSGRLDTWKSKLQLHLFFPSEWSEDDHVMVRTCRHICV